MKNFRTYLKQVAYVLSRFSNEALHGHLEKMIGQWIETRFSPVLIGEWISLGVWNPLVAAFLLDSSVSPSHILEGRVPPALVESVCRGESPAEDIVKLFFGGRLETEFVGTTSYSHAERIALVLGRFNEEAVGGQREDMLRRWLETRFDPILIGAWMSAGVWAPEVADELWDQNIGPVDIFNHGVPHSLIKDVCGGRQNVEQIRKIIANRWYNN